MRNGYSHQNGQGPDLSEGKHANIIDIRREGRDIPLAETLGTSLAGSRNSDDGPTFPSMLLWDQQGLQLFEEITYTDEYYLTNTEIGILEKHSSDIAVSISPNSMVIELGSGNLRKIKILLQALDKLGRAVDYYALDLSRPELKRSLEQVPQDTFKYVKCHGLLGNYDDAREWLQSLENDHRPKCVVSLGSSIGSFSRAGAAEFLSGFGRSMDCRGNPSLGPAQELSIIVGLDACIDERRVWRAYNDLGGVNKRFIMNALDHANSMLGYDAFTRSDWIVVGEWNKATGSHDQFLVPQKEVLFQGVHIVARTKVLVVHSHKYNIKQQAQLWLDAGLVEIKRWSEDKPYGIHMLKPSKLLN